MEDRKRKDNQQQQNPDGSRFTKPVAAKGGVVREHGQNFCCPGRSTCCHIDFGVLVICTSVLGVDADRIFPFNSTRYRRSRKN